LLSVCEEALEALTLSFVLNPGALDQLKGELVWKTFMRQVLFFTLGRNIRFVAHEQLYAIATKATGKPSIVTFFVTFLFEIVQNSVNEKPHHSKDVFHLLCNLLRYSCQTKIALPKHEQLLLAQIEWLKHAKVRSVHFYKLKILKSIF
jgi:hypothetical protein